MEPEICKAFLYGKLVASAGLTAIIGTDPGEGDAPAVYDSTASKTAPAKFVVFQAMPSPADTTPQDKERQMVVFDYLVQAVVPGRHFPFDAQAAIDAALHNISAVDSNHSIHCHRISAFELAREDGGFEFRQAGGRYRLTISKPL